MYLYDGKERECVRVRAYTCARACLFGRRFRYLFFVDRNNLPSGNKQ